MLSHLATRGIATRNICGVWVEDERAFRRHTVHPNLCHFLESIPSTLSLKEMISCVYVSYLYSISLSFHQPTPFCMTVWPVPTGIIVLLPARLAWDLALQEHCMFWETWPSKAFGQTASVSRAWMLQGIISSFSPKFLPVGSFKECCLDWYLLCWLFSVLSTS